MYSNREKPPETPFSVCEQKIEFVKKVIWGFLFNFNARLGGDQHCDRTHRLASVT